MNPTLARQYQSVETQILDAASALDRALDLLRALPMDTCNRLSLLRLLKTTHALDRACDSLADRFEDAGQVLCPLDEPVSF